MGVHPNTTKSTSNLGRGNNSCVIANTHFHKCYSFSSPKFSGFLNLGEVGRGLLCKRLRQQTLEQPLHLPRGLAHSPPQRLDPRHHARKLFLQAQRG